MNNFDNTSTFHYSCARRMGTQAGKNGAHKKDVSKRFDSIPNNMNYLCILNDENTKLRTRYETRIGERVK